ncbi:hypothetical protein BG015_008896 [Linnemannia schmuckeri]|uniref:Fungal lipase-type domain-containing protein n=1 Tax=Linnemannia schmuckeri TaxID=64567 RepID=A0A9P5RYE8_9FUNG|nr:hypothetical protein BG015_008896 [Linnemannia schmuckeri]
MANGKNRLFWLTSLAIASIPLAVTFYGIHSDRRWLTILSFVVFVICLLLSTCTFVSWKTFKFSTPIILQILRGTSYALSPLANILRNIPVLSNVVNGSIKLIFWSWFVILMFSDVLVRKLLKGFVGLHEPSAGQYSTVNACDTNFQPCGEFGKVLDKEKVKRIEEGGRNFENDHDYDERKVVLRPRNNTNSNGSRKSKERPKSMHMDFKYKTPGKDGSDLASMSSADWAKVLEMANIDKARYCSEQGFDDDDNLPSADSSQAKQGGDRPRYSQPIATTLAMVAKLVYEDVPIIRHELARSGYDLHSFRAIAYKNTCGFIVQKGRNIVLVFRGTDPLNLQNAWTDLQSRLVPIQTLQDPPVPLGKCHQGMYNALGKADDFLLPSEQLAQQQREESRLGHRRYSDTDLDEHGYPLHLDESLPTRHSNTSPASSFRSEATRTNTLNLELSNQSVYQTIVTSIRAACILIKFLIVGLFTHVTDPVDYRFAGEIRDLGAFAQACRWVDGLRLEHAEREYRKMQKSKGSHYRGYSSGSRRVSRSNSLGSLYSQDELDYLEDIDGYDAGRKRRSRQASENKDPFQSIESWRDIGNSILDIYNNQYRNEQDGDYKRKKLRFYICGHSLGGALATIFLAKMVECNSPLLDIFSGLYTFGCPRLGDKDFSHAFGPRLACKMFHHVHNNDIFARVPFWGTYETPPGTLVFIDSSRTLTLYPPDPLTLMPVPVRGISFMHLSGILNVRVIMRMRQESWLRILERILLPFFLNDHFPGDYVKALAEGKIEIVVQDTAHFGGVDETETSKAAQRGYFSFWSRKPSKTIDVKPAPVVPSGTSTGVQERRRIESSLGSRRRAVSVGGKVVGRGGVLSDSLSGGNDSGYGAGNRSDEAENSRARRRIVKYTYCDEDEADIPVRSDYSRRSKSKNNMNSRRGTSDITPGTEA